MDDPFDQNNSGMPNVSVIDGDTIGPDNRGSDPGVVTGTGTTDVNGEARFTVTVSMQPGNNYRAGASVVQIAINATTQAQADTNSPPQNVLFTNMLTVWRKLWVERDTMVAPDPTELRFVGPIHAIFPTPGRPGLTTVQTTFPMSFNGDLNNYEEGTVTFTNCDLFQSK